MRDAGNSSNIQGGNIYPNKAKNKAIDKKDSSNETTEQECLFHKGEDCWNKKYLQQLMKNSMKDAMICYWDKLPHNMNMISKRSSLFYPTIQLASCGGKQLGGRDYSVSFSFHYLVFLNLSVWVPSFLIIPFTDLGCHTQTMETDFF